jgi:undecaprenyl-diphosphatase
MPLLLEVILLGIIEGLTEFLPVSSTGHIIVFGYALGFQDAEAIFTVVVQLGAIAAVVWYLRKDLFAKVGGLLRAERASLLFWKLLVIATIPAGIIGLFLDNYMDKFTVPVVVASALIAGGIVLWLVDRRPVTKTPVEPDLKKISTKQAWVVGLGQCLALIPGVSRSGATIISGLGAGIDRPTATLFSFYLSIPVLVLASGYKLTAHSEAIGDISGGPGMLLVGVAASFVTALLAVSWLLKYISHHNFRPFAYYRIGLGIIILLALLVV